MKKVSEMIKQDTTIPVDRIKLVGLQFIEDVEIGLSVGLDFSNMKAGFPKLTLLLPEGEGKGSCLDIDMDPHLPLRCIPNTTIELSDMLGCLGSCYTVRSVEDLFSQLCTHMVLRVITVTVEQTDFDKVVFTCMISGYEGEGVCTLAGVSHVFEALQ